MYTPTIIRSVLLYSFLCGATACNVPNDPSKAEYWIDRLGDKHEGEAAVAKLGELKNPIAVEPLLQLLKENDKLKASAAQSLGMIGDARAVPALMAAVTVDPGTANNDETKQKVRVTAAAINALAELKAKEATDLVLQAYGKARDVSVRMACVRAMGAIRDPKFIPAMHDLIAQDDDMHTRKVAVELLGEMRDLTAVPQLIMAMYVEKAGISTYPQAAFSLYQIGAPAVGPLTLTLMGKNPQVEKLAADKNFVEGATSIKALEVLADLGAKEAEDAVISVWNVKNEDTRPYVRRGVALALGRIGTSKGVAHLSKALDEPSGELRSFYTEALNELSDRSALPALLAASKKGVIDSAKKASFVAYTRLGDARELSAAQAMAKATPAFASEVVRLEAAKECADNVECWIGKLKDKDERVRDRAAYALGRAGDKKAADPLVAALADKNLEVRYAIIWALRLLGSKAHVAQLKTIATAEKGLPTHRGPGDLKKLIVQLDR